MRRRYPCPVTPEQLSDLIVASLADLSAEGAITLPDGVPEAVTVERPRQKGHGDYATNVALQLAKQAGHAAARLRRSGRRRGCAPADGIAGVEVAGPGFLNISVDAGAQGAVADDIVAAGSAYGGSEAGEQAEGQRRVRLGQPDRPGHAGQRPLGGGRRHPRAAAGGERLPGRRREYYFNDHGAQIDRFSRSLLAGRAARADARGRLPRAVHRRDRRGGRRRTTPRRPGCPTTRRSRRSGGTASGIMFEEIKQTLARLPGAVRRRTSTRTTSTSPAPPTARIARLRELGNIYEKDGAIWLRTEKYGDDKDRVIVKSDGHGAYISGDAAYYLDKRERGFDRCIILLGADHHGYVGRMMALCAAFGDEPGVNLEIIIGQMVNLLSHGSVVRMGKRTGNIITLLDLVEAIGVDAARYALVRNSPRDQPRHRRRPVGQGHQRQPGLLRAVRPRPGLRRSCATPPTSASSPAPTPSCSPTRRRASCCGRWPSSRASSRPRPTLREPHRVARYLEDTAASYHRFYDNCRVLPMGDEEPTDLHRARLRLVEATRIVLANGLGLLGVSAPERM